MKKGIIKNAVRVVVVLAAVAFLAATQDIGSLLAGIKQISIIPLLAGSLLFIFANFFVGVRWKGLLGTLDIHLPVWSAAKITFVGMFYNNMLLSNIGGDLLRVWYVAKYTDKRVEAAFSVVVDRVCGFAACLIMAAVGLFLSRGIFTAESSAQAQQPQTPQGMPLLTKLTIVAVVAFALCVVVAIVAWKMGKLDGLIEKIKSHLKRFAAAFMLYAKNPLSLLKAMIITLFAQSVSVLAIYTACSSLNVDAPLKVYFIFFPLSWVIGALPVSPGGLGVLELGVVAMFASLPQVSNEQALTLALCQRLIFIAGSLPGLVIHLCGFHLPKEQ